MKASRTECYRQASRLRFSVLWLNCAVLSGLCVLIVGGSILQVSFAQTERESSIGREVSVPRHLKDGEEFTLSLETLIKQGKLLFNANWTEQEGGGRPLTKGTGRPLSDPSRPLTGTRAFNRISVPNANSCAGCHNAPCGISGGGVLVSH